MSKFALIGNAKLGRIDRSNTFAAGMSADPNMKAADHPPSTAYMHQ